MSFTIAIQRKGKLFEKSANLLENNGIAVERNADVLKSICARTGVTVLYLRDDDIPQYVQHGAADFGIVGRNVVVEKQPTVITERDLNFAACKLVIAVPEQSSVQALADLEGERIATAYPGILETYLRGNNMNASIITIQGSVEVAPELNIADAVCDLTQTGRTLQQHSLRVIDTVLESEAVLIRNTNSIVPKPFTL